MPQIAATIAATIAAAIATLIAPAMIAAAMLAAPAAAGEARSYSVGDDSYHVYFGGDLTTAQGRAAALAVVEQAAAKLCRNGSLPVDRKACAASIVASTVHTAKGRLLEVAIAERTRTQLAAN